MAINVGDILQGKVISIKEYGAFVRLESGESGMVHISEVASVYVKDINEYLQKDQEVRVKVISVGEDGKIGLSIKQAMDPEEAARQQQEHAANAAAPQQRPQRPRRPQGQVWQGQVRHEEGPQSFEDMMARFKKTSDEVQSDLKRATGDARRGGGRRKK